MLFRRPNNEQFMHNSVNPFTNFCTKQVKDYSFGIEDKIGKGYSSQVYKAKHNTTSNTVNKLEENVAIKIINLKTLTDQVKVNLVRNQIQCLSIINHPNLLHFIESFQTINNCYIVTEFCQYGDLQKLLRKKGRLSQHQIMDIFWQIFRGYQHLNCAGFIHRDLKPANLFIQSKTIKIADFGFVKHLNQNPQDHYNVGTTIYMAPEAINSNIYSQKSDIWSLGIICYELIHGRVPWVGPNEQSIRKQINMHQPQINSKLVSRCLHKNPHHRLNISMMHNHPWIKKISDHIYSYSIRNQLKHLSLSKLGNHQRNQSTDMKHPRNSVGQNYSKPIHTIQTSTNNLRELSKTARNNKQNVYPDNNSQQKHQITNQNHTELFKVRKSDIEKDTSQLILQKLISILNFHRFQFKVYQFVKNHCEIQDQKLIMQIIIQQLIHKFQLQQTMMQKDLNVYGFEGWQQFRNGSHWEVYEKVIREYSIKYRKAYEETCQQKLLINQKQNNRIQKYLISIANSESIFKDTLLYREVQCLFYLLVMTQVNKLAQNNWQAYTQNYKKIAASISSKKNIHSSNYTEELSKLRQKLQLLNRQFIQRCHQ